MQTGHVVLDELGAETGAAEIRLDIANRAFVSGLRLRLQVDMRQDTGPEVVPRGKQRPELFGLDALETPAQPGMERHVLVGLEKERIEKQLAELTIASPRITGVIHRERADVDERRTWAHPLDVKGGGVLQRHALLERCKRHVELQKRRVPEHTEGPLVGVGDHRDRLVFQDGDPLGVQSRQTRSVADLLGRDHVTLSRQALEEIGRGELLPVLKRVPAQTAQNRAVVTEDPCVGIAKRRSFEWEGFSRDPHARATSGCRP